MKKKVILDKNPRLNVTVNKSYSASEVRAIAQDLRDYIIERSKRGLGKGAKPWSGKAGEYSESYANSLDFKIAGKSKNRVDLTLADEMLETLEVKVRGKQITIEGAEDQRGKIEGNVKGTYGQKSPIAGKARNFLDITNEELNRIKANYPLRGENARERRQETVRESQASTERALDLVNDLFFDGDPSET